MQAQSATKISTEIILSVDGKIQTPLQLPAESSPEPVSVPCYWIRSQGRQKLRTPQSQTRPTEKGSHSSLHFQSSKLQFPITQSWDSVPSRLTRSQVPCARQILVIAGVLRVHCLSADVVLDNITM